MHRWLADDSDDVLLPQNALRSSHDLVVDREGDRPFLSLSQSDFLRIDDSIVARAEGDELTRDVALNASSTCVLPVEEERSSEASASQAKRSRGSAASSSSADDDETQPSSSSKRRRVPRGNACERCRRGRRKCDSEQPCSECKAKGSDCVRPKPPEAAPPSPFDGTDTACDAKFELQEGAHEGYEFLHKARCVWASPRLCRAVDFRLDELRGRSPVQMLHHVDCERLAAIAKERNNLRPPPFPGLTEMWAYGIMRLRHRDGRIVCFRVRRCMEFHQGDDVFTNRVHGAAFALLKPLSLQKANDFLKKHNMMPAGVQ